jgi:hypothetical protein
MVHVPYSIVNRTGLLSCNTPPQLYGLGLVACSISELLLKLWIISTIGKTPWKGNQPHARPLRPQDNTTQKAKTNFHAVRGIRAHDFSIQAIKPTPQTAWNVTLYTQLGHKHFYKLFVKYYYHHHHQRQHLYYLCSITYRSLIQGFSTFSDLRPHWPFLIYLCAALLYLKTIYWNFTVRC